jgi:hypothetical protein
VPRRCAPAVKAASSPAATLAVSRYDPMHIVAHTILRINSMPDDGCTA